MAEQTKTTEFDVQASTEKWKWAGLVLMGLFFLAFPLFRLYEPAQRADAREAQLGFLAAEGAELFETNCSECHGREGSGAFAPAIGSKEFLESVTDTQISQLTALGVPGTEMVAYSNDLGGPLTSQEIRSITVFLRSLEEDAESNPIWRTPLADSNLTGQELFLLACSRCHGVDAEGIEDVAPDISQDSLTLQESDQFIIGRITDGYKLMPRFGATLTDAQIMSIVTYMRYGTAPPPDATTTTTVPGDGGTTDTTLADGGTTDTTLADGGTTDTTLGTPETNPVLALGERVFQVTAGFDGCQECHGPEGKGSVEAPGIRGASRSVLINALGGGIPDMNFETPLTPEEIDAVALYLQYLLTLP